MKKQLLVAIVVAMYLCGGEAKGEIINGNFETGDFTGWEVDDFFAQTVVIHDSGEPPGSPSSNGSKYAEITVFEFAEILPSWSNVTVGQTFFASAGDVLRLDYLAQGSSFGFSAQADVFIGLVDQESNQFESLLSLVADVNTGFFDEVGAIMHTMPSSSTYRLEMLVGAGVDSPDGEIENAIATLYIDNVTLLLASLPGDANGDGLVDAADLAVVLANWSAGDSLATGDLNSDGTVDAADLAFLFGPEGDPAVEAAQLSSVPEPSSLLLASLGLMGLLGCSRPSGPRIRLGETRS